MMNSQSALKGTTIVPGTTFQPVSDRDVAHRFKLLTADFSRGELAEAAYRTKDAAKAWKEGKQAPSAASLINMAATNMRVRAWLRGIIENGGEELSQSPEFIDKVIRMSQHDNDVGRAARLVLRTALNQIPNNGGE